MFIHDTVPPGVEAMKRLKYQITTTARKTAKGAQLRIATRSPQALIAVHEFVRGFLLMRFSQSCSGNG
jgi:hypothetical protein